MIKLPQRAVILVAVLIFSTASFAQVSYPDRPIRMLVPFAPGGGTDIVGRVLSQQMTSALGQSVVVDNRPGAGGSMGEEMIARATPDGYTIGMVSGYGTNAAIYKLSYDQVNDVQALIAIGDSGMIVTLHPAVPIKSIKEFIAYAKANPGKLNYSSSGTGAITHLSTSCSTSRRAYTLRIFRSRVPAPRLLRCFRRKSISFSVACPRLCLTSQVGGCAALR